MFCLDNLTTHDVKQRDPWDLDPDTEFNYPTNGFADVDEYRTWTKNINTRYCIFSLVEGEIKAQRVTSMNEPVRIHGIVADYDPAGGFNAQEVQDFVARSLASDHPVNYISSSYSDGVHAVWFFEEPIAVRGMKSARAFLQKCSKELQLSKLGRGMDKTTTDPIRYYRYGKSWKTVSNHVIPSQTVWAWMHAAVKSDHYTAYGEAIPLEDVFKEVEKRWPGAWPHKFEEGVRGPTFFDPHGGHRSTDSAIVRENGMQVFNMEKGFYAWGEILGPKFVKQYTQQHVGRAVEAFFHDGKSFWELHDDRFYQHDKSNTVLRLKVKYGLSSKVAKGVQNSEMEEALSTIIETKSVKAAVPFVYNPERLMDFNGDTFLNVSRTKVHAPHPDPQDWGVNFPFIAALLEGVYGNKQLPYWKAWAARFYQSAYEGAPAPGHAVFTIGPTGCGKTFINTGILAPLFGGQSPCGAFMMGESKYTASLFEKGLWTLDDNNPASTAAKYKHYTSMVKALVANAVFEIEEKFCPAGRVAWFGRLCVTANLTEEDIRMVPEIDNHTRDKVMVFRAHSHNVKFGTFQQNADTVMSELPFFARWLLDHSTPKKLQSKSRFGVKEYIDTNIEAFFMDNSRHAYILEAVEYFKEQYFDGSNNSPKDWRGTSAQFLTLLAGWRELGKLLEGKRDQDIGMALGYFLRKGVPWLSKTARRWIIKDV